MAHSTPHITTGGDAAEAPSRPGVLVDVNGRIDFCVSKRDEPASDVMDWRSVDRSDVLDNEAAELSADNEGISRGCR